MSMSDFKSKLFQDELSKLLEKYAIFGAFFELSEDEQCLCCICGRSEGLNIKLNDQAIDQENFKKVIENLYNTYCK